MVSNIDISNFRYCFLGLFFRTLLWMLYLVRLKFDALTEIVCQALSLIECVSFLLKISQYGGHVLRAGGESDDEPHVCLHLGLTDYRLLLSAHLGVVSFLFIMVSDIDNDRITMILGS